jgi:hypothetical protein
LLLRKSTAAKFCRWTTFLVRYWSKKKGTTADKGHISNGESDMGDKGSKDKGKKEQRKKAQRTPKEKRKDKKEKKNK